MVPGRRRTALVTILLPFLVKIAGSVALRAKDSACLFWNLLRNIPGAEPKSTSGGSICGVKENMERWRAEKE